MIAGKLYKRFVFLGVMILLLQCKKPYTAPAISEPNNYLVIDGFLNAGMDDTTIIKLSRARNLSSQDSFPVETAASVTIASDAGDIYYLYETVGGVYKLDHINPDINKKYQLRITTANNKNYVSDFVPVRITPGIDSISWRQKPDGVHIYANTHDPRDSTRYYQWNYEETYVYRAPVASQLIYVDHQIINRDSANRIDTCWNSSVSTNIILGSSARLSEDIISEGLIQVIPVGDIRLYHEYSVLVKQFGLTKGGFDFWLTLSKNTEQLGTLFDARPSHVKGNIYSVDDASEPVIGYFSAYSVEQKRIFIHGYELTDWEKIPYVCDSIVVSNNPDSLETYFGPNFYLPITPKYDFFGNLIGYYGAAHNCTDCTSGGGTTRKPDFWK